MTGAVSLKILRGDFSLDASFRIPPGITALFGRSGAGKSTVLQMIAGLTKPDAGRIVVDGETLFDSASQIDIPPHARRIGYVFQDSRLFPHLSVKQNLVYGQRRAGIDESTSARHFADVVALLGLEHLLDRKPITLSGGERSRVALGRALLMRPRALLLDEPLAALDQQRKAEILPYLETLRNEKHMPILYVSHATDEVTRLADRLVLIENGHVLAEGSVFDVTSRIDLATGNALGRGAILEAKVLSHDDAQGVSEVLLGAQVLVVTRVARETGSRIRLRIAAEDIMLALTRPEGVSANNILPARILAIHTEDLFADIALDIGGPHIIARITRRSLERLKLKDGMALFAVIKSVTVGGRA